LIADRTDIFNDGLRRADPITQLKSAGGSSRHGSPDIGKPLLR